MICLKHILILQHLVLCVKQFYKIKDKKKNNKLVNVIDSGLSDLKDKIKKMSEHEKKIEQPDKVLKTAKEILDFNKKIQEGLGLKILTLDQMLIRIPISLGRLNTGDNSDKLKNETRKLLYSLYRQKILQNKSIKVWLTLFKNGNNIYEH